MQSKNPRVGVGVFVLKHKKILIGKRKSSSGNGTWGLPGGHLEFGESFHDCALRETKEESNIDIKDITFLGITNDIFEQKHYVTIFMLSQYKAGEAELTDFDEFYEWKWFEIQDLPKNLFFPLQNFLATHKKLFQQLSSDL